MAWQGESPAAGEEMPRGFRQVIADWSADVRTFRVSQLKATMWVFILSDIFLFAIFLCAYAVVRLAATAPWPDAAEIFALQIGATQVPLLLIAIMTFILISSSGTMALGVLYGFRGDRGKAGLFVGLTALLGLTFLGMQVYEWTDLIGKGYLPWENPAGAPQFGAVFFVLTGFHGLHVLAGVVYLITVALKILRGAYERAGSYEGVEVCGLYWHFVDLVWVFVFAFLYLI